MLKKFKKMEMHVKCSIKPYTNSDTSTVFTLLEEPCIICEIKSKFLTVAFKIIKRCIKPAFHTLLHYPSEAYFFSVLLFN